MTPRASSYPTFAFTTLTTGGHENWASPLFAPPLIAAELDARYCRLDAARGPFLINLVLEDLLPHRFVADWMNVRYAVRALHLINSAAQCGLLLWWGWPLLGALLARQHGGRGLAVGRGTQAGSHSRPAGPAATKYP